MNKIDIDMIVSALPLDKKSRKLTGYNFRCPICLDSKTNKDKKRAWIYYSKSVFHCYNCSAHMSFSDFLKAYFYDHYKDYLKSIGFGRIKENKKEQLEEVKKLQNPLEELDLIRVLALDKSHPAYKYVNDRLIPFKYKQQLYYTDNYMLWIHNLLGKFDKDKLPKSDKRIVIPHFNKFNKIFCVQGRALYKTDVRYLTILFDETHENIGGLDTIDKTQNIYLTEGYFDHCFLDNSLCINSSNVNLDFLLTIAPKKRFIFVYDNEYRNRQIVSRIKKVINLGFKVCILPQHIKKYGKDINKMIVNGITKEEIKSFIDENTYCGIAAIVKLNGILST